MATGHGSSMSLHGPANFFPLHAPDEEVENGYTLRSYLVGDLIVPLVALDVEKHPDIELGTGIDGEPDTTGRTLWPSTTLVASLLLRLKLLLGSTDILELGSGSGFCGLVARQLARTVILSDREPRMLQLARRNLRIQPSSAAAALTYVESVGWAAGDRWPTEQYGLVIASDVLYGTHQSMRTCPQELERLVALLDHCVASDGMAIIGHVQRNSRARDDLTAALERRFSTVCTLTADECCDAALLARAGNAGLRSSRVLLCMRRADCSAAAAILACVCEKQARSEAEGMSSSVQLTAADAAEPPQLPMPPPLPPNSLRWLSNSTGTGVPPAGLNDADVAAECRMDVRRLRWIESQIISGVAHYSSSASLKDELRGFYNNEYDRKTMAASHTASSQQTGTSRSLWQSLAPTFTASLNAILTAAPPRPPPRPWRTPTRILTLTLSPSPSPRPATKPPALDKLPSVCPCRLGDATAGTVCRHVPSAKFRQGCQGEERLLYDPVPPAHVK